MPQILSDTFVRANTSTGAAGTTTGAGNSWTDAAGSVWQIASNQLKATVGATVFGYPLVRPSASETFKEQRLVVTTASAGNDMYWLAELRRASATTTSDAYVLIAGVQASGIGIVYIYKRISGSLTVLSVLTNTWTHVAGHNYTFDYRANSASPTTLQIIATDTTTGLQVASVSVTDSSAGLQSTGRYALNAYSATNGKVILFASAATYQYDSLPASITVTDSNLLFSGQWGPASSGVRVTNNPGATLKMNLTGTEAAALVVDVSAIATAGKPAADYPRLRWSVNNAPWQSWQIVSGQTQVLLSPTLATGSNNSIEIYFEGVNINNDRWGSSGVLPLASVRCGGLAIETGGSTAAYTARSGGKWLFFGDSITEGWNASSSAGTAASQSASQSWAHHFAAALNVEPTIVAFGSQGVGQAGLGNVPAFYTGTTYNKLWFGQTHDLTLYDGIAIFHGTGTNGGVTQSDAQALLTALRPLMKSGAWLVWIMPTTAVSGSTNNTNITAAVAAYITASGDTKCKLVTLPVTEGLDQFTNYARFYTDVIHPTTEGHARIGAEAAVAVKTAITNTGGLIGGGNLSGGLL